MINKVILIGNLGRDPETRATQGGSFVAKLAVATAERVRKGDEWVDQVEWHRVVCFGRLAENVGRFLKKGRLVYVEGRIRTEKWKDQSGNDRYTTEVVANEIRFLGGGGQRETEPSRAAPADTAPASGGYGGDRGGYDGGGYNAGAGDEDIPF